MPILRAGQTYDKRWYEDFSVGEVLEYGRTEVTEEEIIAFGRAYDPEPYHVDAEAAKETFFGELIASGVQVCGWWRGMNQLAFPNMFSEGSPGWDEVRWKAKVRPGDVLSARTTILEMRPSGSKPHLGVVRLGNETFDAKGEIKMTHQSIIFYRRNPDRIGRD